MVAGGREVLDHGVVAGLRDEVGKGAVGVLMVDEGWPKPLRVVEVLGELTGISVATYASDATASPVALS